MSIIEFIAGILILATSILVSGACYFVKNDKGGVNAALGGASDYMSTRRNDNNLKLNKFVAAGAIAMTVLILAVTIYSAHF
jgi:hypothetical protein